MPGRILIVDDIATNRIVLKVKLAAASYDVSQAETIEAAASALVLQSPLLVILSDRLGGPDAAPAFVRRLRADPATGALAVMVIGYGFSPERRLSLLAAGADDVLERPIDEGVLLARVRSLIRQHAERSPEPVLDGFGLAEAPAAWEPPGLIWVVAHQASDAISLKAALGTAPGTQVVAITRAAALDALRGGPAPDLFLIASDPPELADFRLLAELRARPETSAAALVVMGGKGSAEAQIMALDLGAADVVPGEVGIEELALRLRLRLRWKRLCDRRRAEVEHGLRLALIDPLTGLANRRAAFSRLVGIGGDDPDADYALMILDIDRFKAINDRLGHSAGDRVLAEVARRLIDGVRDRDLVARIGGEEFLVALPCTGLVPARLTAERLRRSVEAAPVQIGGGESVFVTLSIGLCLASSAEAVDDAINRADRALYAAKARGRNTVTVSQSVA
jgi:two-component system cell cycle response regulator